MAYATASKAFKAGQFSYTVVPNLSGPDQSSIIQPIAPEKVINMEAGLRTTWLDGRLRINPTGYWMAWTNRQAARQQPCPGDPSCPTGFRIVTVNSGDIDVYGFELDAQLAITRGLTLEGSAGTTKYHLKDPVANSGPYLFPDQPTPTFNVGLNYTTVPTRVGEFVANLNYAYRGPAQTHPTALPGDSAYELPSYGLWNGRVQLRLPNDKTTVSLYGNNLTDKVYATYATRFGGGFWDSGAPTGRAAPPRSALSWVMGRPREFGVTVQHWF
jgi:iron complex outermembrane receptor protein